MTYGLPAEGDLDWADPLNNSVETTYAAAQAAAADAASAKSNATQAIAIAQGVKDFVEAPTDGQIAQKIQDAASLTASALSATYTQRVEPFSLTLNTDGSVATETVGGKVTTYAYNTDGSLHTSTRDGVTITFAYDANGNMTGAS